MPRKKEKRQKDQGINFYVGFLKRIARPQKGDSAAMTQLRLQAVDRLLVIDKVMTTEDIARFGHPQMPRIVQPSVYTGTTPAKDPDPVLPSVSIDAMLDKLRSEQSKEATHAST